ncbi:MAG TPA: DMT family transporter [Candidatus Dormibacteraeota bacterium]|nr:DMT family transporter [Candidatus Dormibacteraeota bacterium]
MERSARAGSGIRVDPVGWVLALLYVFLWASAFVPSKILSVEGQPLWMLVIRFFLAGAAVAAVAAASRRRFPATAAGWIELALLGTLANAVYLGLSYLSLEHLSSGMGAIIASTNPLILALVAPRLLGEPLTVRKGLGLALGFGGVVALMIVRAGSSTARPQDVGLAVLGVVAFVFSTILFKRIQSRHDLVVATAVQLTAAAIVLLPCAYGFEGAFRAVVTPELVGSMAYLVVIISVGASLIWFHLLTHGEASRVSAFYFLTPVFGLALGALMLGEHVAPRDLFGLLSIAAGISLVQRS